MKVENVVEPIFGNWYIDEKIGSGAFGTVYRIKREDFGKTYYSALKVIRIPQSQTELLSVRNEFDSEKSLSDYYTNFVQDFAKEIELMAELKGNTNIVSFEDHSFIRNPDGIGWTILIRMELLTPFPVFQSENRLVNEDIVRLGIDICSALEICEAQNIIHRDIKPENIFISKNGNYELGDFGIARELEKTTGGLSKKGTYSYMAPEVYLGKPYNNTVDIYSLGIMMYKLLNHNRAPFMPAYPAPITFTDREQSLQKRMGGNEIPDITDIPPVLNAIVKKACAFDPKERYANAAEMKAALQAALESDAPTVNGETAAPPVMAQPIPPEPTPMPSEPTPIPPEPTPMPSEPTPMPTPNPTPMPTPNPTPMPTPEPPQEDEKTSSPFDAYITDKSLPEAPEETVAAPPVPDAVDKTVSPFDSTVAGSFARAAAPQAVPATAPRIPNGNAGAARGNAVARTAAPRQPDIIAEHFEPVNPQKNKKKSVKIPIIIAACAVPLIIIAIIVIAICTHSSQFVMIDTDYAGISLSLPDTYQNVKESLVAIGFEDRESFDEIVEDEYWKVRLETSNGSEIQLYVKATDNWQVNDGKVYAVILLNGGVTVNSIGVGMTRDTIENTLTIRDMWTEENVSCYITDQGRIDVGYDDDTAFQIVYDVEE